MSLSLSSLSPLSLTTKKLFARILIPRGGGGSPALARSQKVRKRQRTWLSDGYRQIFWPFGLLDYGSATLRCKIWSLPFLGLRPHSLHPGAIQGKEGIKFCHLATLLWIPLVSIFCSHFLPPPFSQILPFLVKTNGEACCIVLMWWLLISFHNNVKIFCNLGTTF